MAPIKLFYPISVVKISHGFAATIVYMSDGGKLEVNSYAIIMFWCFYQTTAITGVDTEKEIMELKRLNLRLGTYTWAKHL